MEPQTRDFLRGEAKEKVRREPERVSFDRAVQVLGGSAVDASQVGIQDDLLSPDFDDAGVNLTRIESRPNPLIPWSVHFFVDVDGHREDRDVAAAIENLRAQCDLLKILGSYPRHVPQNP